MESTNRRMRPPIPTAPNPFVQVPSASAEAALTAALISVVFAVGMLVGVIAAKVL